MDVQHAGIPDSVTFKQLPDDPNRSVRIAVARALPHVVSMDADSYECIRVRLNNDTSAIVRACASAL